MLMITCKFIVVVHLE